MQRRKLFTYWEGPKPEFVTMCEEIIAHKVTNTFDYIRLTPENLYQYIPAEEFPPNYHLITKIDHKTDYLRCLLMIRYGGVWLDTDQILLNDLVTIDELLNTNDYVSYEWSPQSPSLGFLASAFIAANPQKIYFEQWRGCMSEQLSANHEFPPGTLGYACVRPIVQQILQDDTIKYHTFPTTSSFVPLRHDQLDCYFEPNQCNINTQGLYSVKLFNAQVPQWFKNASRQEILQRDCWVSQLFRNNLP